MYRTCNFLTFAPNGDIDATKVVDANADPARPAAPASPAAYPQPVGGTANPDRASAFANFGRQAGGQNDAPDLRTVTADVFLSYLLAQLKEAEGIGKTPTPTSTYHRKFLEKDINDRLIPNRYPSYGPANDNVPRLKYVDKWLDSRGNIPQMLESQMGFNPKPSEYAPDAAMIEMVRLSPPKSRWDRVSAVERYAAGLFFHYKRNPISPLTVLRLAPFPCIFSFSEAFDLYLRLTAWRTRTTGNSQLVRAHLPSLIEPQTLTGKHEGFGLPSEATTGWMVNEFDSGAWPDYEHEPYAKRKAIAAGVWEAMKPLPKDTSIGTLLDAEFKFQNGANTSTTHLLNPAVVDRQLISFPLFAMNIRFLDQLGIYLKNELATRLREKTYEHPDSLATHEEALVNVLAQ